MTDAEKQMVLYLIYDGGCDCCCKCIHLNKESCGKYISPEDYSGECSDDYCIDGMIKYFEQQELTKNNIDYKKILNYLEQKLERDIKLWEAKGAKEEYAADKDTYMVGAYTAYSCCLQFLKNLCEHKIPSNIYSL